MFCSSSKTRSEPPYQFASDELRRKLATGDQSSREEEEKEGGGKKEERRNRKEGEGGGKRRKGGAAYWIWISYVCLYRLPLSPMTFLPPPPVIEAYFFYLNVLGNWSSKLFAIALLASGQSSTITGTYAGQYVMQGFLDLRITPWIRNLLTRSLAIVPSLIVALIGGSAAAGKLIIIASMILSFELPFALVPLLKFTSSETKMGSYANSTVIAAITWIISSLIVAINSYYLGTGFINLLLHSGLQTVSIVFAGIFGFSGMLIYVAAILYLVFRRNRNSTQPLLQDQSCETKSSSYDLPREDIASMQLPQRISALDLD